MFTPTNVLTLLFIVAVFVTVLLRLFGLSWRKSLVAGFVLVPIALGAAGLLGYASIEALKRSGVNMGFLLFGGLATLVIVAAGGVAMSKNILYSGFFLMGTLVGIAGLYLFIGADFVGVAQLIIYIGGILVLILFAVLLTNRIGAINVSNRPVNFVAQGAAGTVALLVFLFLVFGPVLTTKWALTEAVATPTTARLGDAFLREYLLPFELISLVLLMALVGAMVIARRAARDAALDAKEAPGLERLE